MSGHNSTPSKQEFSFTTFFQEQERQTPFFQKPVTPVEALRMERRPSVENRDAGDRPLWLRLPNWVPIVCWIGTSSFVILQNKQILSGMGFAHPVALTTIHLAFQTIATRVLRKYTNLVDKAKELEATGAMNRESFLRKIVPVGLLFSASLVLSNWVYLRLSVSFIQMIKAFTPVSVLLVSASFGSKELNAKIMAIVTLISFGVALASYGELEFELIGFLVQALAIGIESCRLVLVQMLLQGMNMDPLSSVSLPFILFSGTDEQSASRSLYYMAPVCLVVNSIILLPVEGFQVFRDAIDLVGIPTLFGNACMTFALNLSSVWLIGKASGLILTLAGVLKDILLIAGSWAILGSTITSTQLFGYAIALTGLVWFKLQG
ncbi:SPOSA6832_01203 [Sporobolomyces salmonicolor]|uniref:SPOSA6832_01203-mRNA-1:cds n=1 Tax=Sporidiobolus salmonicolor TaxID=5005 RepID=A0A0D6EI18_SPOSA|nr:SPOSA6832_01203 [Sporobolomyces salmonicolor]